MQPLSNSIQKVSLLSGLAFFAVCATFATPQGQGGQSNQAGGKNSLSWGNTGNRGPRHVGTSGADVALGDLVIPMPSNLDSFVQDFEAAVRLGKALFWDIQAGSDGMTACATCHYNAGADGRIKNQLAAGADGQFHQFPGEWGPNAVLNAGDFPFTLREDPADEASPLVRSVDDYFVSTGVSNRQFLSVTPGEGQEEGDVLADPIFNVGGINVDRSTARNAPSVINAVFSHRLFWDGRADAIFNGVNPFGPRDPNAFVYQSINGVATPVQVSIDRAALASQAVMPPTNSVEMSYHGKDFVQLGRKLISARPLLHQFVEPTDYHIGFLSAHPERGMAASLTYEDMIKDAFLPEWWESATDIGGHSQMESNFSLFWGLALLSYQSRLVSDQTPFDEFVAGDTTALTPAQKRGMDLFFTIDVGCFTCHVGTEFAGGTYTQLNDPLEGRGGALERMGGVATGQMSSFIIGTTPSFTEPFLDFDPRGKQISVTKPDGQVLMIGDVPGPNDTCESSREAVDLFPGPAYPHKPFHPLFPDPTLVVEMTIKIEGNYLPQGICELELDIHWISSDEANLDAGDYPVIIDGQTVGVVVVPVAMPDGVYDLGYYNLGIRPTAEDLGAGRDGPFGPMSIVKRIQQGDPTVAHLDLQPPHEPVDPNEVTFMNGAFRAPTLRNVALNAPYFHGGSHGTLEQVVQFYARGADFDNSPDLVLDMLGMPLLRDHPNNQKDLIAFLHALTDERVEMRSGIFSAPSLPLKDGHLGNHLAVVDKGNGEAQTIVEEIPATGMDGGLPLPRFIYELDTKVQRLFDGQDTLQEEGLLGCGAMSATTDSERRVGLVLPRKPGTDVIVAVSSSNPSALVLDKTEVIFTPQDWEEAHWITVTGVQDGINDGDQLVTLQIGAAMSGDPAYNGAEIEDVTFTVTDTSSIVDAVFVDASASSGHENGSAQYPFTALASALECAPDGMRVNVLPGVYAVNDLLIRDQSIEIVAANGATLIGNGIGPVITFVGAATSGTVLQGLVITGGGGAAGGLLLTDGAQVELVDCSIENNMGQSSGGILVRNNAILTMSDCSIRNNHGQRGAGIMLEGGTAVLTDCDLRDNTASQAGGGLAAINGASLLIEGCSIRDNIAPNGGGLYLEGVQAVVRTSEITGNQATSQGGGCYMMNSSDLLLEKSLVANNSSSAGAGLWLDGGNANLLRSTVASNFGAQIHLRNSASLDLETSILWGGPEIAVTRSFAHGVQGSVSHSISDFQTWATGLSLPLNQDPMFSNPGAGDHMVQSGSPAIDSGNPAVGPDPDGSAPDMGSHPFVGN